MATFVTVLVEEHDAIPDGCSMRFKASGEARPVTRVRWEAEDGPGGEVAWAVVGATSGGGAVPATVRPVDDSSAGTSMLVTGGDHGLRLTSDAGDEAAVPFLLLAPPAVLG